MDAKSSLRRAAELIKVSRCTLALTGAGISTESGIPDFRSPGTGLWNKMDPFKVASASAFLKDPAAFYRSFAELWHGYRQAEPNDAHRALARLEQEGMLSGVITQNIDGLHIKAGSRTVWEVHGNLRTCRCLSCGRSFSFEFLWERYRGGENPPRCGECRGVLRPNVVLFGDPLGEEFYAAARAMERCQLLITVGTSLTVYPVASLPQRAEKLIVVNREPTPYDGRADVVIRGSASQALAGIMAALEKI